MNWISNSELSSLSAHTSSGIWKQQSEGQRFHREFCAKWEFFPACTIPFVSCQYQDSISHQTAFPKSFCFLRISAQIWPLQGQPSCCQDVGNTGTACGTIPAAFQENRGAGMEQHSRDTPPGEDAGLGIVWMPTGNASSN